MSEKFYPIVIQQLSDEDGGGYLARAVDLYGCIGDGETPEEAIACLREAVGEWIREIVSLGREIPVPGAAIAEAAEHHRQLIELVKAQHELLELQARSISEQSDNLQDLRERVERLSLLMLQFSQEDARGDDQSWIASTLVMDRTKNASTH